MSVPVVVHIRIRYSTHVSRLPCHHKVIFWKVPVSVHVQGEQRELHLKSWAMICLTESRAGFAFLLHGALQSYVVAPHALLAGTANYDFIWHRQHQGFVRPQGEPLDD